MLDKTEVTWETSFPTGYKTPGWRWCWRRLAWGCSLSSLYEKGSHAVGGDRHGTSLFQSCMSIDAVCGGSYYLLARASAVVGRQKSAKTPYQFIIYPSNLWPTSSTHHWTSLQAHIIMCSTSATSCIVKGRPKRSEHQRDLFVIWSRSMYWSSYPLLIWEHLPNVQHLF